MPNWHGGWMRIIPIFERAASILSRFEYKYAAQDCSPARFERSRKVPGSSFPGVGPGSAFTDAYRWCDRLTFCRKPASGSREVLEDLVGKKIVFRNGWEPTSTFLLLNYRDEGNGGKVQRATFDKLSPSKKRRRITAIPMRTVCHFS
jgi:hypothetical protein